MLHKLLMLSLAAWTASLRMTEATSGHSTSGHTTIQTDHSMGIRVYSFLISAPELNSTAYELRVYLRAACENGGKNVRLRGFAGAFPVEGSGPTGLSLFSPHFQPPAMHQKKLQVLSTAANRTTNLTWYGPSNQGLWRLEGKVTPAGDDLLTLEGSYHVHQLPMDCKGSMVALGPAQHTPLPAAGLWNVITTTSANKLAPDTLAYLLHLHMQYHERLGFTGTILRCNKGEAQEVSVLPHVEALVAANKLIIWPWVHEHSTAHTPFYWQKPRHQLTLLAAYGSGIKLAFFDLDEYLVLPHGGTLSNSSCMGKPLLQHNIPAWSFARYSTQSCREGTDLQCWRDGQALPVTTGLDLLLERCPCRFHKPLLHPDRVLTMSVHFVWAWGARVVDVPQSCGFLLHMHALVNRRGHFMPARQEEDRYVRARWVLNSSGSGQVVTTRLAGSANISSQLYDVATGERMRKAAGKHQAKQFSMC